MVAIISIKCIQIYNIDSSILFPKKETSLLQRCNVAEGLSYLKSEVPNRYYFEIINRIDKNTIRHLIQHCNTATTQQLMA